MSLAKIFIVVGVALMLYGVYLLVSWLRLERRLTERTAGTVLGYEANRGKGRRADVDEIAHLKVEFFVDGERYLLMEKQSLTPSEKYVKGTKVDILYDPVNPTRFRVANNKSDLHGSWALLAVGAAMALLGILFG